VARTAAVFFDVDFTLIHPGPRFQGAGYAAACRRHGLAVDAGRFTQAVAGAAAVLDSGDDLYDAELFVRYCRRIIELMGGVSPAADTVARELYVEWAEHHHFSLYDDVRESLEALVDLDIRLGLISNSHRPLDSFIDHFDLGRFFTVAVSSAEHGYLKPHPEIFQAALGRMRVEAARAVMVGDSLRHDVVGARQVGMAGILLARGEPPPTREVTVIGTLRDLPDFVRPVNPAAR
jgi:HAD superfamily hydrolase (TIGR01662 family)